ncbi:MAG: ABC transporter ATP-binding protein [Ardenticatenaceae bacterium]|nr:ABC transporter ATP-binding protein [Ardenticatenaceae bacterium]
MKQHLLGICRRYWRPLVIFLIVGISQTFVGLYTIVFFQRLLDEVVAVRTLAPLWWPLGWFVGLTAVNYLLIYLEGYPRSILNNGAYLWTKLRAMKKIMHIDYLAYQTLGTGNLIQVIENGATGAKNILNGFYLQIVRSIIPSIVITFGFIGYYDQTLLLIILGLYIILFFLSYYLMVTLQREMDKMLSQQEDFSKFSVRGFMELVVFRVNGRFHHEYNRVKAISDKIVRSQAKIQLVQELFFTGFAFLIFILEIIVIVRQVNQIILGLSTVGTLVALVTFIREVGYPISTFSMAYVNYKMDVVAFRRFESFLAQPEDEGLTRTSPLQLSSGTIEFQQVDFAFDEVAVLSDLNLRLAGGKTTALVGTSGSGKSTLVRLLLHLFKPDNGRILIDGQDLAAVDLRSFYQQVAYIPQEPPVFDGTIRENLLFEAVLAEEVVRQALQQVDLLALVDRLPDGLETAVGERGLKLSGGERQRLAFARVLLHQPQIIILDEPTAALDSVTERFVTDNMRRFLQGRTVIVIAHRLQTVQTADEILVVANGRIAQRGCFATLVKEPGLFQQLWQEQTTFSS